MWLVVYKQHYYPSAFECETKEKAEALYKEIKEGREFNDPNDSLYINEDGKLYITEIKGSHGTNKEDVNWHLNVR